MEIKNNKNGGIDIINTEKFMCDIEKKVYNEFLSKKFIILSQGNNSNTVFKIMYDTEYNKYLKELKKTLRGAYKNIFNPIKTINDLEYIWCKYVFIGVLDDDYVIKQRNRLYDNMNNPTDEVKLKIQRIKEKINKRIK